MRIITPRGLVGVLGILVAASCATSPARQAENAVAPEAAAAEADADEAEQADTPRYVREASLPAGYPAPGESGRIQIKQYPAARLVRAQAADHGGPDRLFRPLFNHIKKHQIAMTAPVEMTYDTGEGDAAPAVRSMAFIYPSRDLGELGRDDTVEVLETEPMTVVSVGVRGGYSTARFAEHYRVLEVWLAGQTAYEAAGPPRYLAYNSPFVPGFMKYGEVQVPVREVGQE